MRKFWLLLIPALLIALPMLGLNWLNSEGGRHAVERMAEKQTGGTVRLTGLGGSLPGKVRVARIELTDQDGVWATIEDAVLDWSPSALLRDRISIQTLAARQVTLARPPNESGSSGKGELPLRIALDRLQIDRLDLTEPAASLTVSGSADLPSLWHSRADLAIKRLDGEGNYQLHALLNGDGSEIRIVAEEPSQGLLSRLAGLPDLGRLQLHANLAGPPEAERIAFDLTAGPLSGEGHGRADFKSRNLDLDLGIQSPAMTPRPDLSWQSARLEAHLHGAFDQPGAEGHLIVEDVVSGDSTLERAEADLTGKSDGKLGVTARLIGLHPEGVPPDLLGKAPVELTAEATLTGQEHPVSFSVFHPLIQAQGKTALTEGTPFSLEATLPDLAALAPLTGMAIPGRATLKGQIGQDGRIDLRWNAEASDLAKLGAPVEGKLAAKGSLEGSASQFRATAEAQGKLAGAPLALSVKLDREGGATRIAIERGRWKSVEAAGTLDLAPRQERASGSLQAKVGDLDDFSPLVGTQLSGSGEAKLAMEPGRKPRAVIHAEARQLTWQGGGLGHAVLEGTVEDPLGHPAASLHLTAEQIDEAGFSGAADLSAEGPETDLKLSAKADLQGPKGPATLSAAATAVLPRHTLQVNGLQTAYQDETARLLAPATLTYGGPVMLKGARLAVGPAEFSIDGQLSPGSALDIAMKKVDLAPFLKIRGSLSAEAHLRGETAQVALKLDSGKNGALTVAGTVPLQSGGSADLSAKGGFDLAVLEPILAAEGREARGRMTVDARISGSLDEPKVEGGAELQEVSLQDYAQGIHLSSITGKLQAEKGALRLSGLSGKAGPGRFTLEGTIGVSQPDMPVDLTLSGRNLRPLASDLLTADMNADLKLGGAVKKDLSVSGKVKVNRADINIPDSLPPSVATLKVTRKGAPPPPQAPPAVVALDVSVDAPEQIFVRGRGVDAEMGGKLHVGGTTRDPQVDGGFDLRHGTYNLAGQTMNITQGHIGFDGGGLGGKLDPALNLTSESSSNGIDATLTVTGHADAPVLKLSSVPDLPQDEILARLLFNESVGQLTLLQMASIAQGVAQMSGVGGGGGFDPMAMLRNKLGIDRLSVSKSGNGGEGNSNTMVEAGKYVATGVYVGTRQGLNGGTQARVQIDLTRNLKLDTLIGTGGGTPATGTTIENDPGSSIGLTWQFDY